MSFFNLNLDKCKRDGICAAVCPVGIIKNDENKVPFIKEISAPICIACGLCVSFCPHEACTVEKQDSSQFVPIEKDLKISNSSAVQFLKSRRTFRNFKNRALDESDLKTILDVVRYAPSAKNSQKTRWIVVRGFDKIKELSDLMATYLEKLSDDKTIDPKKAIEANRLAGAYRKGREIFFRGAPDLIVAVLPKDHEWQQDASIALAYLELAAYGIGAGACWAGFFTEISNNNDTVRKFLDIKEDEVVCGAQVVGYPMYRPKTIPSRKVLDVKYVD